MRGSRTCGTLPLKRFREKPALCQYRRGPSAAEPYVHPMAVPASAQSPRPPGKDRGFSSSVVTSTTGGCRNHNRGKRVHREIVQPPGRDDRAGPHFQPVVVLLTRLTT